WTLYFFFQAEDGIRDFHVTGVQTCALPILSSWVATAAARELVNRASSPRPRPRFLFVIRSETLWSVRHWRPDGYGDSFLRPGPGRPRRPGMLYRTSAPVSHGWALRPAAHYGE